MSIDVHVLRGPVRGALESEGTDTRALSVAVETYYWKPMAALFRAVEMDLYVRSRARLTGPTLDVGCGDGRVSQMLARLGVVESVDCGVEISAVELGKAQQTGVHRKLMLGDARSLPIDDRSYQSVLCNGVLCCVPGGAHQAVAEIQRVLKPGGVLACTVPTDRFNDMLTVPRLAGKVSARLEQRMLRTLDRRTGHCELLSADGWRDMLVRQGFEIRAMRPFFTPGTGALWSWLFMRPFHAFRLLRELGSDQMSGVAARALEARLRNTVLAERAVQEDHGYVWFLAEKTA